MWIVNGPLCIICPLITGTDTDRRKGRGMKPETNEYGPLKGFKPEKDEYTKPTNGSYKEQWE